MKRKVLTAAGICIGILILTEGSRYFVQNQKCQKQLFAMDTYMEFTAYGKNSEKAVDAAIEEVQKLDAMLSAENSKSEVYALNEQGNLQATDDLAELILRGKEIYQETDGLFDDTIYPVMKLWGFPTGNYHVPTAAEVQKKLALVDGNKVEIQTRDSDEKGRDSKEKANFVTLGADQQIDFGGIAKGYTGQKLAELFQEYGVSSALVSLGGNIQAIGTKPDGSSWKVGIRDPKGGHASATVSSEAIKGAVKEALSSKSGEVSEPKVTAADLRTNLLFAATENALLNISAPEGADVFYTTDGSDPKGDDASKKKLNQPTLSLNGNGNDADETISLKLAAQKDGKWSKVLEIPLTFVKIPPLDTGTKVYTGQAECKGNEGKPYTVKVRVTTVNGRIALLEDNGTEIPGYIDESFWLGGDVMGAEGMPKKLKGKTLEEVLKARTTPSEKEEEKVDAISGATLSSDAVKYAVIDALRSKPLREGTGEIAPPTFQSTRQVAPNGKINSIFVTMKAPEGAVIHYTTDGSEPTEDSPTPSKDPIFHEDSGAELKAERETYADGRVILLKAAAFQDGKRSETVTGRYVFANPNPKHSYELGQFSGKADGITARVEFESPNFDQKYYLTKIRLDDASEKAYAAFLPELFSQIYLKQGVEGVTPISGHEEESRKVLAAVQAALQEGSVAAEPVITVTPKQGNYGNDEKVTVEITCATDGAEIYYVVENSNDLTNGKLSDFEKHKVLYEKTLTLTMENPKGGTLYIRAAAKVGEKNWSPTARKDLTFVKAVGTEAFEVNGSKYGTWKEAVSALEEAGSGEIILRDDVELQEKDAFPSVSCAIRSGNERKCKIKGGVMEAKADITFENVVYDVNRIYGNGHSVTIGADVETPFSFTKRAIFAGTAHDAEEKEITANPVLSVESGKFALYGSGSSGTTLKGNVEIKVKGTADVEIAGAYMNSTVDGKVTVSVEDGAVLSEFLGELSKGSVQALELVMTGSPKLDGRTFRGTVNGTPKGTLDLRQASLSPEQVEKFKDFAEVLKADSPAAEETLTKPDEETVTVEKEKEEAAEEAAVIAKMIAEAVSDFSDPGESDLL